MRISVSENYYHDRECRLEDCNRRYCNVHRLLWRDHETVKEAIEGDSDVINGTRIILEQGDCPECERHYERSRLERFLKELHYAA